MQVLEKGRKQRGWATEARCTGTGNGGGGCGALLLVDESDLYRTGCDADTTFACSECGVETNLSGVPVTVAARLPTKAARQADRRWRLAQPSFPER